MAWTHTTTGETAQQQRVLLQQQQSHLLGLHFVMAASIIRRAYVQELAEHT
jgi:hypothetical protein